MPSRNKQTPQQELSPVELKPELLAPLDEPTGEDTKGELGFFDYLRSMPAGIMQSSLIYIYRIEPKTNKLGGGPVYIDRIAADGVDEAWLKEKHGGGKYRLWLNTSDKSKDIQRVVSIAGPAKIYPEFELVDGAGNRLTEHASNPSSQAVTQSDMVEVLKTALTAVKDKGSSAEEAVESAMSLMKKAHEGSLEILLKNQSNGNNDSATAALLRELLTEIRAQRNPGDRKLDKIVDAGLDRLLNPPPAEKPKSLVEMLTELKSLQELDGLRGIFGGSKESPWWEPLVGKIAESISEALKANAPALIETYREKARMDFFLFQQRRGAQPVQQAQTQSAPVAPTAVTPAAPTQHLPLPLPSTGSDVAPPAYPLPTPGASSPAGPPAAQTSTPQTNMTEEDQMIALMRKQITELIATCFDAGDNGKDAAITVKRAHKPLLQFIRPYFQDFEKVKELARVEPALAPFVNHPEFADFVKDFWENFMTDAE